MNKLEMVQAMMRAVGDRMHDIATVQDYRASDEWARLHHMSDMLHDIEIGFIKEDYLYEEDLEELSFAGFDWDYYVSSERDVLEPQIEAAGYKILGRWFTGDGDSFGPLTRCVKVQRESDGRVITFVYG